MAITRPKPKTPDEFVAAAPDAPAKKGVRRGKREQITLTLAPELLEKVDALAKRMGQSRAATINLAIFRLIEAEASRP
jgi:Ribbon-helix-helix protein, copG family